MNPLILGNVVSLIGCVLMVITGFLRSKRQILTVQCFQFGFLGAANLIMGAYSGAVSGVISIIRNLVFSKKESSTPLKLVFIGLQLILSLKSILSSPLEWLPLLSGVLFTWVVDAKSERTLKIAIMAAQAMWFIYDLNYQNYVAMTFDALTVLSNIIGIWMLNKKTK